MAFPLIPTRRAMCLDGCDTDIALHGLCPHGVVSQVVWGSVAAWTDLHDVRLTDDEVLAATTSLDAGQDLTMYGVVSHLPHLKVLRCAAPMLNMICRERMSQLCSVECENTSDNLLPLLASPKLRCVAYVHAFDTAILKRAVAQVESFSGFAWSHAHLFSSWLFPVPSSLRRVQLGYLEPADVLQILAQAPATLQHVSILGWRTTHPTGREDVFNSGATLPPHLQGFELRDEQPSPNSPSEPRLRIWEFIAPAAPQLRQLVLSAPLAPADVDRIISGCPLLDDLRIRVWGEDDARPAQRLLFTTEGLPMLKRLALQVISAGDRPWAALQGAAGFHGRSTITTLSLLLAGAVSGEAIRPFASRISELAVSRLTSCAGGSFPVCPLLTALAVDTWTADLRDVLELRETFMPHLRRVFRRAPTEPPLPCETVLKFKEFHDTFRFDFTRAFPRPFTLS